MKDEMNSQWNEQYVTQEVAELLQQKGFDLPTHMVYDRFGVKGKIYDNFGYNNHNKYDDLISAPSQSVVMDWLRRTHDIHIFGFVGNDYSNDADGNVVDSWHFWTYNITNTSGDTIYDAYAIFNVIEYESYEDAIEDAIKYCLENLI